jgi:hypothetical protein
VIFLNVAMGIFAGIAIALALVFPTYYGNPNPVWLAIGGFFTLLGLGWSAAVLFQAAKENLLS